MRFFIIRIFILFGLFSPALASAAACNNPTSYFCEEMVGVNAGGSNLLSCTSGTSVAACPTSNLVGTCAGTVTVGPYKATVTDYYYLRPDMSLAIQATNGARVCKQLYSDGVWLAGNAGQTSYTLSLAKTGNGTGTITGSSNGQIFGTVIGPIPIDISCGATCSGNFAGVIRLEATPDSGSTFAGWTGDCSGSSSICLVTMSAAKSVTAVFKTIPFVIKPLFSYNPTAVSLSTQVVFNSDDIGKPGAVFVTGWVPAAALAALGISNPDATLIVSQTKDNPDAPGVAGVRVSQGTLAEADASSFVLVQLTATGWKLVVNGQLLPYASGVLGDAMAAQSILNKADRTLLSEAQFCVGYGISAAEMVSSGRMLTVATVPSSSVTANTNGGCNVALTPYLGLWYNPSESGWGMSLTQHSSNIIFAALYTYDQPGNPAWYVMPSCPVLSGACTGSIYRVTGGTTPAQPWNGANKLVTTAGTGTITFTDANHGKFTFTLNGVAGSKVIERQLFSNGTAQFALDYTDLWWNTNESGWGVALTQDQGMIFAAWYAYDASGKAIWYVGPSCPLISSASGNGCTGDLYQVTGGEGLTSPWLGTNKLVAKVGTVALTFSDANNGVMSYTLNNVAGTRVITRQGF
jgi:hypothetical protein